MGHTNSPTKPVTRCEILEDGETQQKVRLTRYDGCRAAEAANPGAAFTAISECCTEKKKIRRWIPLVVLQRRRFTTRILWSNGWGMCRRCVQSAIISKLKLANGTFLEQWHDSMSEGAHPLNHGQKG